MRVSQKVMIAEEGTIKANLAIYVDYVRESSHKVCHMCPEAVFFVTKKSKKTALGDLSRMSC